MRRTRRRILFAFLLAALAVGIGEGALRAGWGFGTPILYERQPAFEYRMQPNQSVRRFGRQIETNSLGLRGREFPATKSEPRELRILIVGDSVTNGGSNVDQSETAAAVLETRLAKRLNRPVLVINASANSWGPPNQLGFIERFGIFDADIAIVVLSSHDLVDVPDPNSTGAGGPSSPPWCAWTEVASLVWPRLFPGTLPAKRDEGDEALAQQSLAALESLHQRLVTTVPHVAYALCWDRDEQAASAPRPAHDRLRAALTRHDCPVWELGPSLIERKRLDGSAVMADVIHPSRAGHAAMAEAIDAQLAASGWLED
ncbi:MAG: SGNH/GDSL hydrolase family protein [Phycisphaerae bacterium]|nr:SGNH/GDSL hydrolase family protein [Phycisphaerae bacterium]